MVEWWYGRVNKGDLKMIRCIITHSFIQAISIAPLKVKSTTTQRYSRHSTDTVSKLHPEVPQATASEGLAHTWRLEQDSNP